MTIYTIKAARHIKQHVTYQIDSPYQELNSLHKK